MHTLNIVANLVIVAGYLLAPFTWLRHLSLTRPVLASGIVLCCTGALTHLALALGAEQAAWTVFSHVVQAVAVVWFVFGFWRLLLRAAEIRRMAQARYRVTRVATETVDVRDEEER